MAIAYINGSKTDPTGSGATTVASPALSTTSGRLIIVAAYGLRVDYTGLSITAVTDTAGNTYTEAASYTDGGVRQSIYYAYNITGNASNVVTVTFSQECLYRICAQHEYSGALTTDPLDSARNGTVGYGNDLSTGATDSYYANDMMFAFYTMNATPTFTAGDYVQLYCYTSAPGYAYSYRNFRCLIGWDQMNALVTQD